MTGMLPTRRLGDLEISAVGFGAMTLTQTPDSDVERDPSGSRVVGGYGVNERALMAALRSSGASRAGSVLDSVAAATLVLTPLEQALLGLSGEMPMSANPDPRRPR